MGRPTNPDTMPMRRPLLVAVLAATLPTGPLLAANPFTGTWGCTFGGAEFGTLRLSDGSYSFADAMQGGRSSGMMSWQDGAFGVSGGKLAEYRITSGYAYVPPDDPAGAPKLDLYTAMGTVASCTRTGN